MQNKVLSSILNYIKHNKELTCMYTTLFIILAVAYVFISNNYSFYNSAIGTVTKVSTVPKSSKNSSDEDEFTQTLTLLVRNGEFKGSKIKITNSYSSSLVYTERYYKGNDLFISAKDVDGKLTGSITGVKRDKYIVFVVLVLFFCLICFCRLKGILSIISLIVNIGIFILALTLYNRGINLLLVSILSTIIFSIITLIIINGFNKKTAAAVISTLSCVAVIALFSTLMVLKNNDIDYEFMDFLFFGYEQYDANMIFISEILLCGLGAIMDICVTMSSSVNELLVTNPDLTTKQIYSSCRMIGNDILGTMINVMFFSNLAGSIPIMILSMSNGVSLITLMKFNCYFEIARCLTGSIGIVLAIPVATFISIKLFTRRSV